MVDVASVASTAATEHSNHSPNKGGTTEGGFLLILYGNSPVCQDFR